MFHAEYNRKCNAFQGFIMMPAMKKKRANTKNIQELLLMVHKSVLHQLQEFDLSHPNTQEITPTQWHSDVQEITPT